MRYLSQLGWGLLFGLGLAVAEMTSPQKVLAFLDVAGAWDPSLLVVLGGAVTVAAIAFRLILPRQRPLLEPAFHLTPSAGITRSLVVGSALFGIGWGIGGYCPGPAVALLAVPGNPETLPVLGGLALGVALSLRLDRLQASRTAARTAGTHRVA